MVRLSNMSDFVIPNKPLVSAIGEAESFLYRKYVDDFERTWLVKDGRFAADNIYFGEEIRKKIWFGRTLAHDLPRHQIKFPGQIGGGFGGEIITFELINGMKIKLQGPYLSNSEALYKNCAVDIRDRHKTYVVISLDREIKDGVTTLKDVIYQDPFVMESRLDRGEILAKAFARSLQKDVWLYNEFAGRTELKLVRC